MSFTQYDFMIFMACLLPVYYLFSSRLRIQNAIIFGASILFYTAWSKKLLLLILFVSFTGYYGALLIEGWPNKKKMTLTFVVFILLSILAYFKYANFFIEVYGAVLNSIGIRQSSIVLDIILPIGISFHTFQTLAYVIDVYRGDGLAERDFLRFNAFALFFPQLVAGPIERAHDLLPQFGTTRQFDVGKITQACHLIVFGYFFKVFIADSSAEIVNSAFMADQPTGWWTIIGTLAFGLQIYTDFLGYSMIAKGVAQLLGFELKWNFAHPYWATSIKEFWSGWHITLSQWLRDYLYIPLGGNRRGRLVTARNILITMALGGLWHGANWTFIAWGVFHGIALTIYHLVVSNLQVRINKHVGWFTTMCVVFVGWFLFRARNWAEVTGMVKAFDNMEWYPAHWIAISSLGFLVSILFLFEYFERRKGDRFAVLGLSPWIGSLFYGCALFLTLAFSTRAGSSFIYFQF